MNKNIAYTIRIGRRGRDAWLAVDGIGNVTGRVAGSMTRLDVSPILYIGLFFYNLMLFKKIYYFYYIYYIYLKNNLKYYK